MKITRSKKTCLVCRAVLGRRTVADGSRHGGRKNITGPRTNYYVRARKM